MNNDFRKPEIDLICGALEANQSLLVIGKTGEGKSHIAAKIQGEMSARGWTAWLGKYQGGAKPLLESIAEKFDIPTEFDLDEGRTKPMTAIQIRAELTQNLARPKWLLIFDDSDRIPVSLRYWMETLNAEGVRLLLISSPPPPKDIFLKLVRIQLQQFDRNFLREVMTVEAKNLGIALTTDQLSDFEARVGGNPALAKRIVSEQKLGLITDIEGDRPDYIDGTPFILAILGAVSIVRFIGLGLGDRSLYIIGGISMVLGMTIKVLYAAANRRDRRLGA